MQGYFVVSVMWFCMRVDTAERLCELAYPTNLQQIFQQKELNPTRDHSFPTYFSYIEYVVSQSTWY